MRVGAAIFTAALLVDQIAKCCAVRFLPVASGGGRPFLSLGLHRNYGVSFSLFASTPQVGLWLGVFGCLCLAVALFRFKSLRESPGAALLLAGAVGNTLDRLFRGCVVDWLSLGPALNLHINAADIFLCVAGAFLCVRWLMPRRLSPH